MLTPEIIKKIKRIHIKSGRLVDAMMAGSYRSVFRGSGIEFEEVREYSAGDEVRDIDWNVSARMGRPFVKMYREERERVLMLLVDLSGSMGFGTASARKRDVAAEVGAVLAFNAIRNNDRVGVLLFTDRVEKYIPPGKGSAHIWRVIKEIYTFQPQGKGTDIRAALTFLGTAHSRKTIAFLLSDFFSFDYARELRTVSAKHELVGVLVTDKGDVALPGGGLVYMKDSESGQTCRVDAFSASGRKKFERRVGEKLEMVTSLLRQNRIDCVRVEANRASFDDTYVVDVLLAYFRYREKKIR